MSINKLTADCTFQEFNAEAVEKVVLAAIEATNQHNQDCSAAKAAASVEFLKVALKPLSTNAAEAGNNVASDNNETEVALTFNNSDTATVENLNSVKLNESANETTNQPAAEAPVAGATPDHVDPTN